MQKGKVLLSPISHSQPCTPAAYHGPLLVVLWLPVKSTLLLVVIVETQSANKDFVTELNYFTM